MKSKFEFYENGKIKSIEFNSIFAFVSGKIKYSDKEGVELE
jgi:hypothetical protein